MLLVVFAVNESQKRRTRPPYHRRGAGRQHQIFEFKYDAVAPRLTDSGWPRTTSSDKQQHSSSTAAAQQQQQQQQRSSCTAAAAAAAATAAAAAAVRRGCRWRWRLRRQRCGIATVVDKISTEYDITQQQRPRSHLRERGSAGSLASTPEVARTRHVSPANLWCLGISVGCVYRCQAQRTAISTVCCRVGCALVSSDWVAGVPGVARPIV